MAGPGPIRTDKTSRAASSEAGARRKMRKGTHSCFECRRRKIRCIFPPDNSTVCTECFARGSSCIDQESADPESITDTRKNLRERVSRLEALVETLLEENTDSKAAAALEQLREQARPPTPTSLDPATTPYAGGVTGAPVLSLFNNDVLSRGDSEENDQDDPKKTLSFPTNAGEVTITCNVNATKDQVEEGLNPDVASSIARRARIEKRHEQTRQALLSVIPRYERMETIIKGNSSWWETWRHKCPGTSGSYQTLLEFANGVLLRRNPPELGTLLLAIGVCLETDDLDHYQLLVERLIIQDDEYIATLEGMECAILQAKIHSDYGQPRRAWLAYRRGLVFAQLIGLHRNHTTSTARESIWWSLYHGDRFLSVLLGLPYGISDLHCDLSVRQYPNTDPLAASGGLKAAAFQNRLAIIAGQVVDRSQGVKDPAFTDALQIDQLLDELASTMTKEWWDIDQAAIDPRVSPSSMRERLLHQMCFYQIRLHLHLPFMLRSSKTPRYDYARTACIAAARDLLKIYHYIRGGDGEPLYVCKVVDFLGFMAAVLILLSLLGYGELNPQADPKQEEADWRQIEISMDIFQRASTERGGKVAEQSFKALKLLEAVRRGCDQTKPDAGTKIVIPYFGTIQVRRGNRFSTRYDYDGSKDTLPETIIPAQQDSHRQQHQQRKSQHGPLTPRLKTAELPTAGTTRSSGTSDSNTGSGNSALPTPQSDPSMNDPLVFYGNDFSLPVDDPTLPDQLDINHDFNVNTSLPDTTTFDPAATFTGFGSAIFPNLGASNMDIDQDWGWFLSDVQNQNLQQQLNPQQQENTGGGRTGVNRGGSQAGLAGGFMPF